MDKTQINKLLFHHKALSIFKLLRAIPLFLFFAVLQIVFLPLTILGVILKTIDEKVLKSRKASIQFFELIFLFPDMMISYQTATWFYHIRNFIFNFKTQKVKSVLYDSRGFILYLRDFDPAESETLEYKPILRAVYTYSHRDEYLFTGFDINNFSSPMLAILNSKDIKHFNTKISFLRVRNKDWQIVVKKLMEEAQHIIVAVPGSGYFDGLFNIKSIEQGKRLSEEYCNSSKKGLKKNQGLAIEIGAVLNNSSICSKTVLVNVWLDGNPYLTSKWFSMRSFKEIDEKELRCLLSEN